MDHVTNADVRLRAGSPPQLLLLIQTRRLRFFGNMAWMGDSRDLSRVLHTSIRGLPKGLRRRPGRPCHTWLRTLEADLQPLHHGLNSAWRHAQDRGRCKQLVETAMPQSGACPWWWRWWSTPADFETLCPVIIMKAEKWNALSRIFTVLIRGYSTYVSYFWDEYLLQCLNDYSGAYLTHLWENIYCDV